MNINNFIKGLIIGIAKIIPGLSGAVIMISFNLYDRAIESITCFFTNPKKNALFLFNLGIGIILGIILFSKVLSYFLNNYYLYTTSLFLGLIVGGLPIISKSISYNKKNIILFLLSFITIFSLSLIDNSGDYVLKNTYIDYIIFFISGLLEAVGTVLPGISSTALLMLVGVYNHYLTILSGILNPNYLVDSLRFIFPFSLGMIIGIIGLSILVNYLFNNHRESTFSLILGVSVASIIMLGKTLIPYVNSYFSILISLLLLLIGYFITSKLE